MRRDPDTTDEAAGAAHGQPADDVRFDRDGSRAQRQSERSHVGRPQESSRNPTVTVPESQPGAVATRDHTFGVALAAADLLAGAAAVGLVAGAGATPTVGALALAGVLVVLASGAGLYDRDELLLRKTSLEETPRLFTVAGLLTLVATLGSGLFFAESLPSGVGVMLWAALTVGLLGARTVARSLVQTRVPVERCVLFGSAKDEERLARAMAGSPSVELAARVPVERVLVESDSGECEVNLRALEAVVRWSGAERIIVSAEHATPGVTLDLLRASKAVGVRLSFLSVVLGAIGHGLVVDDVYGIPLIGVRRFRLRRRQRAIKRLFDAVVGSALVLALLPIVAIVAVAIKLDSRGPIFFRQKRVGRDGEIFCIVKFRTMVPDAEARKAELRSANEAQGLFKIDDDPRVTRVGRVLRRTSADELPQLINVLRGQMSLVGPRPLVPDEDEQIRGYDRRRLHLTPGMTGHWQILGSARVPLDEMLRIDYRYVTGWTLWEDVKILLRTLPYVLARRGQ